MIITGTYYVSPSENFLDINSADGIVNIVLPTSEAISSYLNGTGGLLPEQISYSISGTSSYPVRFYRGGDKFWNNGLQFIEITQDGEGNISTQGGIQAIAESGTPNSGSIQLIGKKIGLSLNPQTTGLPVIVVGNDCKNEIKVGQKIYSGFDYELSSADIVGVSYKDSQVYITINNIVGFFSVGAAIEILDGDVLICKNSISEYIVVQQSQLISLVGGNNFVLYSVLLTNPSTIIDENVGYLYSEKNYSGINVANISFNPYVSPEVAAESKKEILDIRGGNAALFSPNSFITESTGNVELYPATKFGGNNLLLGNELYFNIDTNQDATCDMYVYGVVIN